MPPTVALEEMMKPSSLVVTASTLLAVAACAGPERTAGPMTPSSARSGGSQLGEVASTSGLPGLGGPSPDGDIVARAVSFPPRNEPLDFGTQLNNLYRDSLKRETVSAFVDLEGRTVWLQEYLRYRVNGCAHTEAISRVFSEIRGGGVPPMCTGAPTGPVSFPPRDQSLDFGMQLNEFYRGSLNRTAVSTFVDLEGSIVWTQEYLWYRVNACGGHSDAVNSVFAQINGGGLQPVCDPSGVGYWDY